MRFQVLKIISVVVPPLIAVTLLAAAGVSVSVVRRSEAIEGAENLRRAEFIRALLTALQRERGTTCIHLEMIRYCQHFLLYKEKPKRHTM